MTNKEKAQAFLGYMADGDNRCKALLMFMSSISMMNYAQILNNIKRLADE